MVAQSVQLPPAVPAEVAPADAIASNGGQFPILRCPGANCPDNARPKLRGSGREEEQGDGAAFAPEIENLLARMEQLLGPTQEVSLRVTLDPTAPDLDEVDTRRWGIVDATFGDRPRFLSRPYLEGYLQELARLPRNAQGEIVYATKPASDVNWGWTERDPQPVTDC